MSAAERETEAAVFQILLPKLEAEGFQVFLHPSRQVLPAFMSHYRPDAIAVKGGKKIAIEILSGGVHKESKLQSLQELFAKNPDWEFRVIYAPPRTPKREIAVPPKEVLLENVDQLMKIFDEAGPVPGLLTAWSTFEAAARSSMPGGLDSPQSPARLVDILASDGYITPEEADTLRRLGELRNEAAHGRLDTMLTRKELKELVDVIRTILGLSETGTPEPASS